MTNRPTLSLALATLLCASLAVPSLGLACDNDHDWSFDSEGNIDETKRIKAYEREQAAKRAQELERRRLLEVQREREARRPQSRTFLYRRWPNRLPRRVRLAKSSLRGRNSWTSPRQSQEFKRQLDSRKLAQVLGALADESFSEGQLEVIERTGDRFDLTVNQAIRLVSVLSWADDRVEALAGLYPSLLDPDNFVEVYRLLSFSSDRKELRRRVRRMN
jgi:hypothetical protein